MNAKQRVLIGVAALTLTASLAAAAPPRGAGQSAAAPMAAGRPGPLVTHNSPAMPGRAPGTPGTTTFHHGHGRNVVVFFDDFGFPFWSPYWYGWYGYPYGYYPYAYYNYQPYHGNVVVQVQSRLARAGYYHGAIDGVMGPRTRAAIRAYERAHGLRVDGAVSGQLLGAMGLRQY